MPPALPPPPSTTGARGLLILGTDTGVGKTQVAAALIHALRLRGMAAVGLKPVESGCIDSVPADATLLRTASQEVLSLEQTCLYRLALPVAPAAAARAEGRSLSLSAIVRHLRSVERQGLFPVVETAGGLYTPLTAKGGFECLGQALDYPALIVARSALGTINHSLLSVRAARHEGLRVLAVLLNRTGPGTSPDEADNARLIARSGQVLVFGPLPCLPGRPGPRFRKLARHLEATGILSRLLAQAKAGKDHVQ